MDTVKFVSMQCYAFLPAGPVAGGVWCVNMGCSRRTILPQPIRAGQSQTKNQTEEKAEVVAAVWWTSLNAAL